MSDRVFVILWAGFEIPMSDPDSGSSALPKQWITPIRLGIYALLAACSGYVYFNVGDMELSHYLVIVSIVAVSAMALLDCRVSDDYWQRQHRQPGQDSNEDD